MYSNKQDNNYKQRKVQDLYRKKRNEEQMENEYNKIWGIIMGICVLVVFLIWNF
jgi:hypothetical protein